MWWSKNIDSEILEMDRIEFNKKILVFVAYFGNAE